MTLREIKADPILRQWRNRLARNARSFRRVRGRWPDQQIMSAVKRTITDAAKQGVKPPYQH